MNSDPIKTKYGYEAVWADGPTYHGKFLVFEKTNSKSDMFMNTKITKTWFVNSGSFKIRWIETSEGKVYEQKLDEGQTFFVPPNKPTQIVSLKDNSSITEASSKDSDDQLLTIIDSLLIG